MLNTTECIGLLMILKLRKGLERKFFYSLQCQHKSLIQSICLGANSELQGMDILIHALEISAVVTESWNLAGSLSVSPLVGITTVPIYGFRLPMTVSGDSTTSFLPESMANTSQKVSTDQAESRLRREKKNTAVKAREEMLWIFGGIEANQPYNVLNLDPSADQGATGQLGSQWPISPTSHCYLSLNICASLLLSLHFSFKSVLSTRVTLWI